jgi:rhomboid family GlyGly-CTERM serine protease
MASAAARADFPRASAALALACLALACAPSALTEAMSYDRPAILAGQFWRLWSGHLVHYSLRHALADTGVLFLIGSVLEPMLGARRLGAALAWGAPLISLTLLLWLPEMHQYRGASGLDMMMAATALVALWRSGGLGRPWLACLGGLLVLKIVCEALGVSPGFASLPQDVAIAWPAHLSGAACGFLSQFCRNRAKPLVV